MLFFYFFSHPNACDDKSRNQANPEPKKQQSVKTKSLSGVYNIHYTVRSRPVCPGLHFAPSSVRPACSFCAAPFTSPFWRFIFLGFRDEKGMAQSQQVNHVSKFEGRRSLNRRSRLQETSSTSALLSLFLPCLHSSTTHCT